MSTNSLVDEFKPFVDQLGFPGNLKSDGSLEFGDSTQRLGMIRLYEEATGEKVIDYPYHIQLIKIMKEEPVRHWDDSIWEGRPGSMSRDNATPLIASSFYAAAEFGERLKQNKGFFWNRNDLEGKPKKSPPDIITLTIIIALIRSYYTQYAKFLPILDIGLVIGSLVRVISFKLDPNHTSDDLNHQVVLLQSKLHYPTFLSKLAIKIYKKWGNKNALMRYFRPRDHMTPPPIHKLYENIL